MSELTDLQTALARFDEMGGTGRYIEPAFDSLMDDEQRLFVEAVRLVANPSWWIEEEQGQRVAGPFTTEEDANRARVWVEAVRKPETFWIRAAALTPQGEER